MYLLVVYKKMGKVTTVLFYIFSTQGAMRKVIFHRAHITFEDAVESVFLSEGSSGSSGKDNV